MDMKQGLIKTHRIELTVEFLVILFLQVGRLPGPRRVGDVNNMVFNNFGFFSAFNHFAFGIFFFLNTLISPKFNGHRKKFAVLVQNTFQTAFFQKLERIFRNVKYYIRTLGLFCGFFHCVVRAAIANPFHRCAVGLLRATDNFHFFSNHKCRVETKTEMTNYRIFLVRVFVFLHEFFSTREGDLGNVFFNFFGRHADPIIPHDNLFFVLIENYFHFQILGVGFQFSERCKCFEFLGGVHRIGNQLAQENLMV